MNGRIMKALAGFYYVKAENGKTYECKAKGAFRNENITPLVGDNVRISVISEADRTGNVDEIFERKNALIRPAVANVDQAMVVFSVKDPNPNLSILDRFLVLMKTQNIETIIVFNKKDLDKTDEVEKLKKIYKNCGCRVYFISAGTKRSSMFRLMRALKGKTTVMAGPSGVGKSTIINVLSNSIFDQNAEVGEISKKLGRGRNTTRHNEIYELRGKYRIIDTPGFTSLLVNESDVSKEELKKMFPEFAPYEGQCPFADCAHIRERDCAVRKAADDGKIPASRYNSYKAVYEELKSQEKY